MSALLRFGGARDQVATVDAWLNSQPDALGAIARTWFSPMRACGADVRELMHDGLATVCVDDAPFAYVGVFKNHVSVGFFHGADLSDPTGLLQGSGKHMRHVKIERDGVVDRAALEALIASAYRDIVSRLQSNG